MKPVLRLALDLTVVAAFIAVWVVAAGMSRASRMARTCQGKGKIEVIVTDSLERRFVAKADVEDWLEKEYGAYAGLPIDSVDLPRIEAVISGHSAVRSCEAWMTDDGVLHVELSQRQPVLRLQNSRNACYTDESGFMFPLQSRGSVDVPVISGELPVALPRGYKGPAATESERLWLERSIALVGYMKGTVWEKNIARMEVDSGGDFLLYPAEGKEVFIFGPAVRIEDKFRLLAAYYRSIVPSREGEGSFTTVDIRHRGQIVCK